MSLDAEKRYQDIAFFNLEKKSAAPEKKSNVMTIIAVSVLVTVVLLAIGYCAGLKAGYFAAPCCFGPLELQFDFEG